MTADQARRNRIIVPDSDIHFPDDFDAFAKKVRVNKIKLAIFDPVNVHLSDNVSRYNDSIRKATSPLKKLCEETGLAVVLIDHVLKNVAKNSHPLSAIGGASSGLSAAARMVYIIGRDPEDKDRILLCNIKSNLRDEPEPFEFTIRRGITMLRSSEAPDVDPARPGRGSPARSTSVRVYCTSQVGEASWVARRRSVRLRLSS